MPVQYQKLLWKGHIVTFPRRYHEESQDGEIKHTPAFGTVIQQGTPFTSDNMNHIENGIADCAALANRLETDKAEQKMFAATIPVTGWTGNAAPYTRNLTVNGILASDTPIIDVVLTGTYSDDVMICDAWANIQRITTQNNILVITAESIPEVAIPIQARCVR